MTFYSVKHRRNVDVPDGDVKKIRYNKGGGNRERFGVVATAMVEGDTVKLTKFINRATFESLKVEEAS
jgi:hypothetical protein